MSFEHWPTCCVCGISAPFVKKRADKKFRCTPCQERKVDKRKRT